MQQREAAVFKWARSGSWGEMTQWTEPWLKAPLLVYFFLALGKHVCWNSQQSATTHCGLTPPLLGLPHMVPSALQQQPQLPALERDRGYVEKTLLRVCLDFVCVLCMYVGSNLCVCICSVLLAPGRLCSRCRPPCYIANLNDFMFLRIKLVKYQCNKRNDISLCTT